MFWLDFALPAFILQMLLIGPAIIWEAFDCYQDKRKKKK